MVLLLKTLDTSPKIESPSFDDINLQDNTNSNTNLMDSSLRPNHQDRHTFPIVSSKSAADNNDFQKSVKNLLNLDEIDEDEIDDEDDIVRPSSYAFAEAYRLLNEVRNYFKTAFPYCSSSLESRGGIHLVWDNPSFGRRVWVKIPYKSGEIDYIFFREKEIGKFTKSFSLSELYRLLIWLNDGARSIGDL